MFTVTQLTRSSFKPRSMVMVQWKGAGGDAGKVGRKVRTQNEVPGEH